MRSQHKTKLVHTGYELWSNDLFSGPWSWLRVNLLLVETLLKCILGFLDALRSWKTTYKSQRELPLPPGSLGLPFIGEMIQFIIQAPTAEFFNRRIHLYGPIYKTHILFNPTVFISGSEGVRKVLLGEHQLVENCWPSSMRRLLGPGALATTSGRKHSDRRRAVLRCFDTDLLDAYLPSITNIINAELDTWATPHLQIEVYSCAKRMAIRAAAEVLIGVKAGDLVEVNRHILDYANGFFVVPIAFPGTAYYKALRAKTELHRILRSALTAKGPSSGGGDKDLSPRCGVMGQLLASSHTADGDQTINHVIDQALELLFGGQETLSAFVTCLVLLLAKNDHVISRLATELSENDLLFGNTVDLNVTSLSKLTYVDCVIREVLRLYPPIGGGYRRVIKAFEIQGFQIPRDWTITYSIKATHEASPLFSADKNVFRPERWSCLTDHDWRYNFLPFGAGARTCIGQRYALLFMRIFTVHLIRRMLNWRLVTVDPVMLIVPIIRPEHGLFVEFEDRKEMSRSVEQIERRGKAT